MPADYSIDAGADHADTDEETTNSDENETSSSSSSSDEEPSLSLADRTWRKIQNRRELTRKSKREEIQDVLAEIAALKYGGVSTPRRTELLVEARSELRAMRMELTLLGG